MYFCFEFHFILYATFLTQSDFISSILFIRWSYKKVPWKILLGYKFWKENWFMLININQSLVWLVFTDFVRGSTKVSGRLKRASKVALQTTEHCWFFMDCQLYRELTMPRQVLRIHLYCNIPYFWTIGRRACF
jgi:hypothetical protein